eukprot:TRINITY_DN6963_c0_g1_i1.p1 TRINITY_DN6963_c0_g1~~TRINITY_DN6963_c0_g1_i1.p1  ORF type:complete len:506 (+),score=168.33 TRINITY_DN6963_c0_g1_i1:264-1781(+)
MAPFIKHANNKMYAGEGMYEYETKKRIAKEAAGERNRAKQMDENHRNNALLRQERLKKLQAVQQQNDQVGLPMIADGPVEVPDQGPAKRCRLTDGSEPEGAEGEHTAPEGAQGEEPPVLHKARACYVCKARFKQLHFFYDQLCPGCAALNWEKRNQLTDLTGMTALVTGCRVKIGFHVALKLLRAGAHVVGTTRFPKDAAGRFSREEDFLQWANRLELHGLDLRDMSSVERLCSALRTRGAKLRVLINNACQTVRRPAAYYAPLVHIESQPLSIQAAQLLHEHTALMVPGTQHSEATGTATDLTNAGVSAANKSQLAFLEEDKSISAAVLPAGKIDANTGQQLDLRSSNSWVTKLEQVQTPEVLEVFAINAIGPFVLNSKLSELMGEQTPSFIVNVSAMEGKFYRTKSPYHPHTNMAKAALNMLTKTSAPDLAQRGVFMTSVDTGWINDENPLEKAQAYADKHSFQTPIDEIDAAARILDPVFSGMTAEQPAFGVFFKDYHETEW